MKPEIQAREVSLEALITNAIQLPGVKVDRQKFLLETFGKRTDVDLQEVLATGGGQMRSGNPFPDCG